MADETAISTYRSFLLAQLLSNAMGLLDLSEGNNLVFGKHLEETVTVFIPALKKEWHYNPIPGHLFTLLSHTHTHTNVARN